MKIEIRTIQDVKDFANSLLRNDGLAFHPDDDFQSYSFKENDVIIPFFTKEEAIIRNKLMDDCFKICDKNSVNIYDIMLQATKETIVFHS